MQEVERFNYFEEVKIDQPMKVLRTYHKYWKKQCWLGTVGVTAEVPIYAHTVKIIQEMKKKNASLDGDIYLKTLYGEYLELPEILEAGRIFKIRDIVGMTILTKAEVINLKANVLKSDKIYCSTEKDGERFCSFSGGKEGFAIEGKAMWYTDVTKSELQELGADLLQDIESLRYEANTLIEKEIEKQANLFTIDIVLYLQKAKSESLDKNKLQELCKTNEANFRAIIRKFKKDCRDSAVLYLYRDDMTEEKLLALICKEVESRILNSITQTQTQLINTVKDGISNMVSNFVSSYLK